MISLKEQHSKFVKLYSFSNGATSPTNIRLVEEMISHLDDELFKTPSTKFLDPCAGTGTFGVVLYDKLLRYHDSKWILENMIFMVDTSRVNCDILKKNGFVNVYNDDFLKFKLDMKFDVIVGNYPYERRVGQSKTEPIWHLFAEKAFKLLKNDGYLSVIHPSAWRNAKSNFDNIKDLYFSKKIISLNLNDFNKGREVFGAGTNFDIITLINTPFENGFKTKIIDDKDNKYFMELKNIPFIPNSNFEKILSLVATNDSDRVNLLFDRSSYGNDKSHMSSEKDDNFKYPCVYTITKKDGINFRYSNKNKGHFGIPKVIWSNGLGTYPIVDNEGEYGVMNFGAAIIDEVENLENIKKALESKSFLNLMKSIKFKNDIYDYRVLATFKKDFWKEFIND